MLMNIRGPAIYSTCSIKFNTSITFVLLCQCPEDYLPMEPVKRRSRRFGEMPQEWQTLIVNGAQIALWQRRKSEELEDYFRLFSYRNDYRHRLESAPGLAVLVSVYGNIIIFLPLDRNSRWRQLMESTTNNSTQHK